MARETELATSLWLPVVGHFISLWFSGVVMTLVTKDIDLASSSRACDKERSHHWTDDFTWFLLPFMLRLHILLPRNATASETVTWGHSWTLQCKSQVVWFGRAKGKHSVFSPTGSLKPPSKQALFPNFQNHKMWDHSSLTWISYSNFVFFCLSYSTPLTETCVSPFRKTCFSEPSPFL